MSCVVIKYSELEELHRKLEASMILLRLVADGVTDEALYKKIRDLISKEDKDDG